MFPGADQQYQGSPPRYSQPGISSSLQIPRRWDAPGCCFWMLGMLWIPGRLGMPWMLGCSDPLDQGIICTLGCSRCSRCWGCSGPRMLQMLGSSGPLRLSSRPQPGWVACRALCPEAAGTHGARCRCRSSAAAAAGAGEERQSSPEASPKLLPAKLAWEEDDATRRSVGRCLSPGRGACVSASVCLCVCRCQPDFYLLLCDAQRRMQNR